MRVDRVVIVTRALGLLLFALTFVLIFVDVALVFPCFAVSWLLCELSLVLQKRAGKHIVTWNAQP